MSGAPEFDIPTSTRSYCGTGTLAVALGGALGGLGRHALAEVAPGGQGLPWATLAVNIVGALAVGILATLIAEGRASSAAVVRSLPVASSQRPRVTMTSTAQPTSK